RIPAHRGSLIFEIVSFTRPWQSARRGLVPRADRMGAKSAGSAGSADRLTDRGARALDFHVLIVAPAGQRGVRDIGLAIEAAHHLVLRLWAVDDIDGVVYLTVRRRQVDGAHQDQNLEHLTRAPALFGFGTASTSNAVSRALGPTLGAAVFKNS